MLDEKKKRGRKRGEKTEKVSRENGRKEFMEKIGWSGMEWSRKIEKESYEEEVERKLKGVQDEEWREKLEKLKCTKKIKIIIGEEKGVYHKELIKSIKDGLETIARLRVGSETESAKYWKREEKLCKMCDKEEENIEHVLEKCEKTGNKRKS